MSRETLEHLRSHLERKLEDLSAARVKRTDLIIVPSTDPVEQAQSRISMDLAVQTIDSNWQTGRAIRSSLERIDTGEYGVCETCSEPIAAMRLRAIPWAALCTACQSSREAVREPLRLLQQAA